jgi:hypothetical protein
MAPDLRRLDWFPWALRAAWAVLPVAAGGGIGEALATHSHPVQTVAAVGLWSGWAVVLLATLVPHPMGLTALRVAAPAALGVALWSGDGPAVATCAVALVPAFAPAAGMLFVNGPAYPNERRFPLRAPGALLAGLLPLSWALAVLPLGAGIVLAATRQKPLAAGLIAVGLPVSAVLLRALHGLSRRWVVFVPAGVVLADPLSLADPVLFQKRTVEEMRLAPADTDSLDLTQRSPGMAVELLLREKVPMTLVRPGRREGEAGSSARLLFTPTRPGAVLAEAKGRGLARSQPPLR